MKLILENWRKFLQEGVMDDKPYRTDAQARKDVLRNASKLGLEENNSEEKIEDALVDTLEKEGGAAGFKPLFDAAREIDEDITEEEVKHVIIGLNWTLVETNLGAGLAHTPAKDLAGCYPIPDSGKLCNRSLSDLAKLVWSNS